MDYNRVPRTGLCSNCKQPVDRNGNYCVACNRAYQRDYQKRNWDRLGKMRRGRVQRARELVREHLRTHPCVDCGESDFVVLQFDHLGDKIASVSRLVQQGHAPARIQAEIDKCEVRCANCHTRKTAKQFGWKVLEF